MPRIKRSQKAGLPPGTLVLLGVMLMLGLSMLAFFKWKKWF